MVVEIVPGPGVSDRQEIACLEGINDWGILLMHGADHPLSEPDRDAAVFVPWRLVSAIWPASEKDLEGPPTDPP